MDNYYLDQEDWKVASAFLLFELNKDRLSLNTVLGEGRPEFPRLADNEELKNLLHANLLVHQYKTNCKKANNKPRMAFFFEVARLYYPNVPQFQSNRPLARGAYSNLEERFEAWGNLACPIIAHAVSNWGRLTSHDGGFPKYPSLNTIFEQHEDFEFQWFITYLRSDWGADIDARDLAYTLVRLTPKVQKIIINEDARVKPYFR